jgi:hypothetical protein
VILKVENIFLHFHFCHKKHWLWIEDFFHYVILCSTMFYNVVLCSTMFYYVRLSSSVFYNVLLCSTMFYYYVLLRCSTSMFYYVSYVLQFLTLLDLTSSWKSLFVWILFLNSSKQKSSKSHITKKNNFKIIQIKPILT